MSLTIEEQERLAYANGDTAIAAILRATIDLYNPRRVDDAQDAVLDRLEHEQALLI